MPETITLSKVERFAIVAAREKTFAAQNELNEIVKDVFESHGIAGADANGWQFANEFKELVHVPRPSHPSPPANPPAPPPPPASE